MEGVRHNKHPKIVKPTGGKFHRNEWTVLGAPCSILEDFISKISAFLSDQDITTGYLDMSHKSENIEVNSACILEDKIDHWILKNKSALNERDYRKIFNHLDLLLINGNHYKGNQQIVFINNKKKESLQKKLDRLTNVKLFVLDENEEKLHEYLGDYQDGSIPVFKISQVRHISDHLIEIFKANTPKLNGLILNGGKSQRMGFTKGDIQYHDKTQKEVEADILDAFCNRTYYSKSEFSKSAEPDKEGEYETILDSFIGLGPYGGILSAFKSNPNCAWLTLACDLPYIDHSTIQQLVEARNTSKLATCFYNPETDFPEPLITIWEPRAYPVLLDFLSQGYSCARKVLINSDIEMIAIKDPIQLKNANTPEEKAEVVEYLRTVK